MTVTDFILNFLYRFDREMKEEFRKAYINLGRRMKDLAESDGAVYLPNPEPSAPVDYILICMEPSLGHWAKGDARKRVKAGFRNFLIDIEPMLLHFSVRERSAVLHY